MCPLQEFPNVLLKISTGVYFSFIKERLSAASLNLPGDLLATHVSGPLWLMKTSRSGVWEDCSDIHKHLRPAK